MNRSIKAVALPREHGSWSYVLEPFVLVLVIAFSLPGLYLFLASFLFFLAHRPVKLVFSLQPVPESRLLAIAISILYISVGLVILFLTLTLLPFNAVLLYASGLLIMLFYLLFDIYKKKRSLLAEQVVPLALAFMAISVLLIDGWSKERSLALFFLLLTRPVPTTFYIHTRLKLEKGLGYSKKMVYFSNLMALFYVTAGAITGWIPISVIFAVLILSYRAVNGISANRKRVTVKKMGMMEFAYGAAFIAITAIGYVWDL